MRTNHIYNVTVRDTDYEETWTLRIVAEDEFHVWEIVDAKYDRQDVPIEIVKITKARRAK